MILLGINNIIINRKIVYIYIESCFFMLLAVKYFEIFTKHNEYRFILELFALNLYISLWH